MSFQYETMTVSELMAERDRVETRFAEVREATPSVPGTRCPPEWRECVNRINALQVLIVERTLEITAEKEAAKKAYFAAEAESSEEEEALKTYCDTGEALRWARNDVERECNICKKAFSGFGNNPYPLCDKEDLTSRCCDECNFCCVIPARIKAAASAGPAGQMLMAVAAGVQRCDECKTVMAAGEETGSRCDGCERWICGSGECYAKATFLGANLYCLRCQKESEMEELESLPEELEDDEIHCRCGKLTGTKNSVWAATCCCCRDITLCEDCCPPSSHTHTDACWSQCVENEYQHRVCLRCEEEEKDRRLNMLLKLYGSLESAYKGLKPAEKVWANDNWKSMVAKWADDLEESASSSVDTHT